MDGRERDLGEREREERSRKLVLRQQDDCDMGRIKGKKKKDVIIEAAIIYLKRNLLLQKCSEIISKRP